MTSNDVMQIIFPTAYANKMLYTNLVKSRFIVAGDEFAKNSKEQDAITQMAEDISIDIIQDGDTISLSVEWGNHPYFKTFNEGDDVPVAGGNNGMVTNPDGSVESSNVPEELWGTPLPWLQKTGTGLQNECETILKTVFEQSVRDAMDAGREDIAEVYKRFILENLGGAK